jgi:Ser/Thr protein kinase RdoA (MazF antagonist)
VLLTAKQLAAVIDILAGRYGLRIVAFRVLARRHNTTVRLDAVPVCTDSQDAGRNVERYVLKIHEPGETSLAEIRSEMQWLAALAKETDLLVPRPVKTLDSQWVTEVEADGLDQPHPCRLMRWVPGRMFGRGMRLVHFSRLGELMAGLHNHSSTFRLPEGFQRRRWDAAMVRHRLSLIEKASGEGLLPREQFDVFRQAAQAGEAMMRDMDRLPDAFGLIHGDLGYTNHLFHGGRAGAIDFEMCGFGYYLCDLSEVLWGVQHVGHFPQIRSALFEGYRRFRPLSPDLERHMGAAIGIAAVTTIGFLVQQRRDDLSILASYLAEHLRDGIC